MFRPIVRDDVFRLETRRLWLRWPSAGDAGDRLVPGYAASAPPGPEITFEIASQAYRQIATIERLRQENASGAALHLVLTGMGADRAPFGAISLTPVRERIENCGLLLRVALDPDRCGKGLMTEAVEAVVDAAFMLTATPLVAASARTLDPAFQRVLGKHGFVSCGAGLDPAVGGASLVASDRFRLDRNIWAGRKTWLAPATTRHRGAVARDCAGCA